MEDFKNRWDRKEKKSCCEDGGICNVYKDNNGSVYTKEEIEKVVAEKRAVTYGRGEKYAGLIVYDTAEIAERMVQEEAVPLKAEILTFDKIKELSQYDPHSYSLKKRERKIS